MLNNPQHELYRTYASSFQVEGDHFLQNKEFDAAIQKYEAAIAELTKIEPEFSDEDFRHLSQYWSSLGDAYNQCGYYKRQDAFNCFSNALKFLERVKSKHNEIYPSIAQIYGNLQLLSSSQSLNYSIFNLGADIFNNGAYTYNIPQKFENSLADLESKPVWMISTTIVEAWRQLLTLILNVWRPEYFPDQSYMKTYLSKTETLEMIQTKSEELGKSHSVLTNTILRSNEFHIGMVLNFASMNNQIDTLKEQVSTLQAQLTELQLRNEKLQKGFSCTIPEDESVASNLIGQSIFKPVQLSSPTVVNNNTPIQQTTPSPTQSD